MPRVPLWRRYLRFFGVDVAADVSEEVRFHLDERVEELVAQGLTPSQARRRALEEFGDVDRVRRGLEAIGRRVDRRRTRARRRSVVLLELRQAIRRLRYAPTFAASAILALALGIGATIAIYAVLDAVVLRPLPYPESDRLVFVDSPVPGLRPGARWGLARHEMFYFKANAPSLEDLGLFRGAEVTVGGDPSGALAERARGVATSSTLFGVLRFRPLLGRLLLPADNLERRPAVVVLGEAYWRRRFGADPAIVGRSIALDGFPVQVVGVLRPGMNLPDAAVDLWLPAYVDPADPARSNHVYQAIGRLRPGTTVPALGRELADLTRRFPEVFPGVYSRKMVDGGFETAVTPLRDQVIGPTVARALWVLLGSVALVLLVAGANVANLFLVRAEGRRREIALRRALGAGRRGLALHFLAEGVVIALVAGVGAWGLAASGLRALLALAPSTLPRLREVHLGPGSAVLGGGLALMAGLVLSLIPMAWSRPERAGVIDEGGRTTPGRRRHALRGALVVGQVATSLVLLAAAGVMTRSSRRLRSVEPGFQPGGVVAAAVALPRGRYDDFERAAAFYRALGDRIGRLPGVRSVGVGELVPLTGEVGCTGVIPEADPGAPRSNACVITMQAGPGYFATLGIRVRGRTPTWAETEGRAGPVVVSRSFAEHLWPGQDPIGKGLRCCNYGPNYYRVVGVADDVRQAGLDRPADEIVYFPLLPIAGDRLDGVPGYMHVVIQTERDQEELAGALRGIVSELDPSVPVANVESMAAVVSRSVANRTFTLVLLGIASAMALAISTVGLYGVVAYLVGERRREIGIRLALGASAAGVGRMVMLESVGLAGVGVVAGIAGALVSMRLLSGLLFGVSPTDPGTLAGISVFLMGLAGVAGYLPARRAMRVDPVETLKAE